MEKCFTFNFTFCVDEKDRELNTEIAIQDLDVRQQVREMANANRLPHAVLFSGQEGGNVLLEAFYLLLYLMCSNRQTDGPCLECRQCKRNVKWMHPDVNLVLPTFDSKQTSGDVIGPWREFVVDRDFFTYDDWSHFMEAGKNPNINRRQTEAVLQSYRLKPYEGGHKVFFVWGVEFLGNESNRFLKILEEPTDQTYFILVTHRKQELLPTIISRVQQFDVKKPEDSMIERYALDQGWGSGEEIREAVYLANGHMVELKSILSQRGQKYSESLLELLKAAYSRNGLAMSQWAEKAAQMSAREYQYFIHYQLHFIRETLAGYFQENYKKRLLPAEQKAATWLLNLIQSSDLIKLVQLLDRYNRSLFQNANVKILSSKNILDYKRLFDNI
ncbi:MAG TPA: hypothetical protein VKZ56_02090 [Membranihabitans sp.]|nr:hypothetical protein [Membranihabitans sp.]